MPKHEVLPPPPPVPATLTEQKADFTAEGAPPPGKVATSLPVTKLTKVTKNGVTPAVPKPGPTAVEKSPKRAG